MFLNEGNSRIGSRARAFQYENLRLLTSNILFSRHAGNIAHSVLKFNTLTVKFRRCYGTRQKQLAPPRTIPDARSRSEKNRKSSASSVLRKDVLHCFSHEKCQRWIALSFPRQSTFCVKHVVGKKDQIRNGTMRHAHDRRLDAPSAGAESSAETPKRLTQTHVFRWTGENLVASVIREACEKRGSRHLVRFRRDALRPRRNSVKRSNGLAFLLKRE